MRNAIPLIALLFATGAAAENRVESPVPLAPTQALGPEAAPLAIPQGPVIGAQGSTPVCRDTIQEVRRDSGKPVLDRDTSPEEPLFIAAVDKRVGGCSVIVMRNDTSDIRPLPEPGEHRLMPAK